MRNYNTIVDTRFGKMIVNRNDVYIGRSLIEYGEFSFGEVELMRQLLRPNAVVVEAGANIGAHTLFLAQHASSGVVFAIEPQRLVYQTLCGNMALNSIVNAICIYAGVSDTMGEVRVPTLDASNEQNFGAMTIEGHSRGEKVPLITIDSLGLPRCDLIKADVEGMEEQVIRGASTTIEKYQPALYLESDREDKRQSLFSYLTRLGYTLYWHLPPLFHQQNFNGSTTNLFPNVASWNVLGLHSSRKQEISGLQRIEVTN